MKQNKPEIVIEAVGEEALREENERKEKEKEINAELQQQIRQKQKELQVEQNKTAQELINEVGLMPHSPSFFKNTKTIKERSYYNYSYQKDKGGKE